MISILGGMGFSCKKGTDEGPEDAVASFTLRGTRIVGNALTFENHSSKAYMYNWDFGDGATSGEASPRHTYTSGGKYTVVFTAKHLGSSSTVSLEVEILDLNKVAGTYVFNGLKIHARSAARDTVKYVNYNAPVSIHDSTLVDPWNSKLVFKTGLSNENYYVFEYSSSSDFGYSTFTYDVANAAATVTDGYQYWGNPTYGYNESSHMNLTGKKL